MSKFREFYYDHKNLFGFLALALGVAIAIGLVVKSNEGSIARDTHTRNTVCLILSQSDASIYSEEKAHLLSHTRALEGLEFTAAVRAKLGPAPACIGRITPSNAKPPFHIAPITQVPKPKVNKTGSSGK